MRAVITILVVLICSAVSAKNDPEKVKAKIDSLKKLGRDSLIKLAVIKNGDSEFVDSGYDRIEVKAYKDKLVVEFSMSVFVTNGCYYEHVSVALVGDGTGRGGNGNCKTLSYHKRTEKERKKIQFVFDCINKSDEIGHLKDNKISEGSSMKITEKLTHYEVEMNSWSTHSEYKVDKVSGKIYDASHKHYARSDRDEKDDFEIIK